MYHKRMTTGANTSIVSYSYHFYFVVRTFRINSLSDIQVHSSTVLLTYSHHAVHQIPRTYSSSNQKSHPLTNTCHFPHTSGCSQVTS